MPRCSVSTNSTNKDMAATEDPAMDSNGSDFDNSDEDLASLLGDDDDDIFAKKMFGNSPAKVSTPEVPSSAAIKTKAQTKITSAHPSFESPLKEISKSLKGETTPKDEFGDDILDEFLESSGGKTASIDLKLPTSEKSKAKRSSFQSEDTDFLDDLSLNQFSPSKDLSNRSPVKKAKPIGKSFDISDDLNTNKSNSKASEGRRGSFFDDFLQKLSPKHGSKKPTKTDISEEKLKSNEESEEDILGAYIPTAPKQNDIASDGHSKSPKRRGSLLKQVSFKDLSDDFPETDIDIPKTVNSPEKRNKFKKTLPEPQKIESVVQTKRSEKASLSKDDEVDWLNFFKDSPKKSSKPPETKRKSSEHFEKKDLPISGKTKPVMKRQSSADWLGLSDSKMLDDDDDDVGGGDAVNSITADEIHIKNLKPTRPKTANIPVVRPRHQEINKTLDEWNDDGDDFIGNVSQSATADLSHILKDTDTKTPEKKTKSAILFAKDSVEIKNIDPISVSKSKKDSKINPKVSRINSDALADSFISDIIVTRKDSVPKDHFDVAQTRKLQESYEHTASLQTMQLMLDDSIKERNKLLKENEATRTTLEEKIKAAEEFYKSERKMLEDSSKTLESSLKQDFEIKLKSLEERLKLITGEKENQARTFEEKMQSILREHQLEIQRLKDLHNQSVNIMKEDHEEALSRLKRLKEQEVEAVLSTQVHSKSLQYLSDQLEARANDLAALQNKIEERSQTTLREKQAHLDAKEKDLKALQNRLQRQLEDGEDERTRLQQLVLRLESRLQKVTVEGEEDHWETQQLKVKLTMRQKYLEEEQKLNQYQVEKEKEKLKLTQDSLLHEQKTVLLQIAQERQQLTQEKIHMQSLAKSIKEEEAKLNVRKLKEESFIETEKQFLLEEKNRLHFDKEKIKQEFYQLERERDSLLREKQQLKKEKEALHEQEMNLKRKSSEIEEIASAAAQEQERGHREHAEAIAIKKEQQIRMQQYSQQMQMLMDKERHILSEREKLMAEKVEFEKERNYVLCTKCKLSLESPVQVSSSQTLNMPVVFPLRNMNGISNQVQQSVVDPNLVIWHITAQKDREFLQEELAFLKSLKDSGIRRKNSKS